MRYLLVGVLLLLLAGCSAIGSPLTIVQTINHFNETNITDYYSSLFWMLNGSSAPPTASWNMGEQGFTNVEAVHFADGFISGINITDTGGATPTMVFNCGIAGCYVRGEGESNTLILGVGTGSNIPFLQAGSSDTIVVADNLNSSHNMTATQFCNWDGICYNITELHSGNNSGLFWDLAGNNAPPTNDWNMGGYTIYEGVFNGTFNWTEDSKYLSFDGQILDYSEAELNSTILAVTSSTTYNGSSIATVDGTVDDGDIISTRGFKDHNSYNISEINNQDWIIYVNYTYVEDFNTIALRVWYSADDDKDHDVHICLWDWNGDEWDCEYGEIGYSDSFVVLTPAVFDSSDHVGTGANMGNVSLMLEHDSEGDKGRPGHDFYLDYAVLVDGFSALTTTLPPTLQDVVNTNPTLETDINAVAKYASDVEGSCFNFYNESLKAGSMCFEYWPTGQVLGLTLNSSENIRLIAGEAGQIHFDGFTKWDDDKEIWFGTGGIGGTDLRMFYSSTDSSFHIMPTFTYPDAIIINNLSTASDFVIHGLQRNLFVANSSTMTVSINGTLNVTENASMEQYAIIEDLIVEGSADINANMDIDGLVDIYNSITTDAPLIARVPNVPMGDNIIEAKRGSTIEFHVNVQGQIFSDADEIRMRDVGGAPNGWYDLYFPTPPLFQSIDVNFPKESTNLTGSTLNEDITGQWDFLNNVNLDSASVTDGISASNITIADTLTAGRSAIQTDMTGAPGKGYLLNLSEGGSERFIVDDEGNTNTTGFLELYNNPEEEAVLTIGIPTLPSGGEPFLSLYEGTDEVLEIDQSGNIKTDGDSIVFYKDGNSLTLQAPFPFLPPTIVLPSSSTTLPGLSLANTFTGLMNTFTSSITVADDIIHRSDTNTKLEFEDDEFIIRVRNYEMAKFHYFDGTGDMRTVFNDGGIDIDHWFESADEGKMFVINGGTNRVGINASSSPSSTLDVGEGTASYIDGVNDILIADDIEVDGTAYIQESLNVTGNLTINPESSFEWASYISAETILTTAGSKRVNPFNASEYGGSPIYEYNGLSGFSINPTSGNVTVNNSGVYSITMGFNMQIQVSDETTLEIFNNGVELWSHDYFVHSSVDPVERTINTIETLNAGDQLQFIARPTDGVDSVYMYDGTWLNIIRIR